MTQVDHNRSDGLLLFRAGSTYDHVGRRLTQTDYDPARAGAFSTAPGPIPALRDLPNVAGVPGPIPALRDLPNVAGVPGPLPALRHAALGATTVQQFTYDEVGRLTSESRDDSPTTTFQYDLAGNRVSQAVAGQATTSYSYDDDNRLTQTTTGGATTLFHYDANGSMTFRDAPDTVQDVTYAWDAAGRLKSLTRDSASPATFTYDGDGNRSSKTSSTGQVTSYVNDARGLSQVLQATVTGGHRTTYVPGVGQYDDAQPNETMRWGYTVSDAQNGRLMVDGGANISRRWEWEPFGRARAEEGVVQARFGYGGEERDDESGLINLRARYYDPAIGRFLSRDSLAGGMTNPQSWNRYSYVENDPINHIDPSGHKKKKIKWPGGQDPDDDRNTAARKEKACRNPGQYTGSCKGGPPNAAYAADGEAQHEAKKAGQAAAAGNLAAAAAHLSAAQHFASIAGTAAANTATLQAYASILAAAQSMLAAHRIDHQGPTNDQELSGDVQALQLGDPTGLCSVGGAWVQCAKRPLPPGLQDLLDQRTRDRDRRGWPFPPLPFYDDDDQQRYLYRAINASDLESIEYDGGIYRRTPYGNYSATDHILIQRGDDDPWISATWSEEVASNFARDPGGPGQVIKIDRKQLTSPVFDFSRGSPKQEVLIHGYVNREAIVDRYHVNSRGP